MFQEFFRYHICRLNQRDGPIDLALNFWILFVVELPKVLPKNFNGPLKVV